MGYRASRAPEASAGPPAACPPSADAVSAASAASCGFPPPETAVTSGIAPYAGTPLKLSSRYPGPVLMATTGVEGAADALSA